MLPPGLRLIMIGIYALISWKFLSLGAIVVGAAMLRSLEGGIEVLVLFPSGALFLYVGALALGRLGYVLDRQGPGF